MHHTNSRFRALHRTVAFALLAVTVSLFAATTAPVETDLPAPGAKASLEDIRRICAARGWDDLWQRIERNPPARPFVNGSCADWSKEWKGPSLQAACFRHSLEYWAGRDGDEVGRLQADTALMLEVARVLNSAAAGVAVFNRVREQGAPQSDNEFAWGYGRRPEPVAESKPVLEKVAAALRPVEIPDFVRTYEPTQIGLTKDRRDDAFMDFQLSLMFPLHGAYPEPMPPAIAPDFRFGDFDFRHPGLFASATLRAGQYINTRPSSPVVGKRFNPQLFLRFWALDESGEATSTDKFLDLIFFGHESNGQAISDEAGFLAQEEVYRQLEKHPDTPDAQVNAFRWARDSISRGWDYVGAEAGWSWRAKYSDPIHDLDVNVTRTLRVKLRYFLHWGVAQQYAEQYYAWEGEGPSHPRRNYDGIKVQYTTFSRVLGRVPLFTGRGTLTYTTGLSEPFRYSTFEADLGFKLGPLPLSIWGRIGYNSDLTDYYHLESGYGFRLSIWKY